MDAIREGDLYVGQDGWDTERYCVRCAAALLPFVRLLAPDDERISAFDKRVMGELHAAMKDFDAPPSS
jgi:hypothetical protein